MFEINPDCNYQYWNINLLKDIELFDLINKSKICVSINPNWKLRIYNNKCSFSYLNIGISSTIIAVYEKKNNYTDFNEKYYISETGEIYYNKKNSSEIDEFSKDAYNSLIKL